VSLVSTLFATTLDAVAVALLGWTTATAARSREQPSAWPFIALLGSLTLWALCSFGSELPVAASGTVLDGVFTFGTIGVVLVIPGIWAVYALSYTGRGTGLTRRRIAMLAGIALPVLVIVAVLAAALATGLETSVVEYVGASMLATEFLYLFGLFVYGTYLLVGLSGGQPRVSRRQVGVLTFGVSAPYVVGAAGSGGATADGVTVGLLAAGGLLAFSVRRYPVMTGFPKADYVARSRVVEALQEAVVVLDWEDRVLDANRTVERLFDRSTDSMIGRPVAAVVTAIEGEDLSAGATGTVTFRTTEGRRRFQYSVSAVDGEGQADPIAKAVVFRDVTGRLAREQRLTVLHRVLRHNVRNKLDVVLAHADRVDDETLRSGIVDSATELLEHSDRAREAEQVMTATTDAPEPVDVTAVAEAVAEEYRSAHPESDVSLESPEALTIPSHGTVIRYALSELVDNALTHAEAAAPRVEIGVRAVADGAVELTVADDGPGIPEREREILASGGETQLRHGLGIGLWFVNWAVVQLGGDLVFEENDPAGSVVTIRLYGQGAPSAPGADPETTEETGPVP
jgi:signal transduction histidine kinase